MPKDIERILSGCFHPKGGKPNLRKIPVKIEKTGPVTLVGSGKFREKAQASVLAA